VSGEEEEEVRGEEEEEVRGEEEEEVRGVEEEEVRGVESIIESIIAIPDRLEHPLLGVSILVHPLCRQIHPVACTHRLRVRWLSCLSRCQLLSLVLEFVRSNHGVLGSPEFRRNCFQL
jgi:hypothetical protein